MVTDEMAFQPSRHRKLAVSGCTSPVGALTRCPGMARMMYMKEAQAETREIIARSFDTHMGSYCVSGAGRAIVGAAS
eukprot:4062461-Prymnesium_polylepis.1